MLHFHVRQIHVRQFYAWTLGPSISRLSNSCLDILMVRHFHVRHSQNPQSNTTGPQPQPQIETGSALKVQQLSKLKR